MAFELRSDQYCDNNKRRLDEQSIPMILTVIDLLASKKSPPFTAFASIMRIYTVTCIRYNM